MVHGTGGTLEHYVLVLSASSFRWDNFLDSRCNAGEIPSEGLTVSRGEVLQVIVTLSRFQDIVNVQGRKLRQGLPIRTAGRNRRQNRAHTYSIGVMATTGVTNDGDRKFAAEAHSNRKKRKRFPHGNYTGYYFTRYGSDPAAVGDNSLRPGDRDPRLSILQRSWFEGKKCLDVGCNEGNLTLAIVRRFRPRQMVGVDIDEDLVELARDTLADEISFAVENAKRRADEGDKGVLNGSAASVIALGGSMKPRPLTLPSLHDGSIAPASVVTTAEKTKTSSAFGDEESLKGKGDYGGRGKDKKGNSCDIDSSEAGVMVVAASVDLVDTPRSETDRAGKGVESVTKAGLASTSKTAVGEGGNKMDMLCGDGTKSAASEGGEGIVQHPELDAAWMATSVTSEDAEKALFLAGCAVSFRCEDFAREAHSGPGGYDVICLFSVVKWMHLNGGDEAVKAVFRKTHQLLRPGGRLILEPQPKKSYRKSARQHGTLKARANVNKIRLWPSDFPRFLTIEVGFRTWEEVGMPGEGIGSFAQRSIHVFLK